MSTARRAARPSDKTFLATGLFARMASAIDQGRFVEARRTRARLAALGFIVSFRNKRPSRRSEGGAL